MQISKVRRSVKDAIPGYSGLRAEFAENLDRATSVTIDNILSVVQRSFDAPVRGDALADLTEDREAALEEWERRLALLWSQEALRPAKLDTLRLAMERDVLRAFTGVINERIQRDLGIEHYVWLSADDDRVRPGHAHRHGKVYAWDEPPEGEQPGQAFNCRCYARPVLLDTPDGVPDAHAIQSYENRRSDTNVRGLRDGTVETIENLADFIASIPNGVAWMWRYSRLLRKEERGTLTAEETRELERMKAERAVIVARIEADIQAGPEGAVEDIEASFEHLELLVERAERLDRLYRQGLATETQALDARYELSVAEGLIASGIVGGVFFARLLRLRSRGDEADADLEDAVIAERARLARQPFEPDWDIIENPGIEWGGPIGRQGHPWEAYLDREDDLGDWIETQSRNYPTYDFYDQVERIATSAKTLDTLAPSYLDRPSRIFGRLTGVIDQMNGFDNGRRQTYKLTADMIDNKRLLLAVPRGTNPQQIIQIERAIEYAADNGVILQVRFVQ